MQRRKFLQLAGTGAAGLALTSFSNCGFATEDKMKSFGIQLYTLRDILPADPKGVLKQLALFGYEEIESYDGGMGMFWGMGPKGFKEYVESLNMKFVSSHCDPYKDLEKKVNEAAEAGIEYLIYAWEGRDKKLDDYKRMPDEFNKMGEYCKKHGIKFAFHNHDYTFVPLEGQLAQTILMENTNPEYVCFEMDMYWVVTAGHNPAEWVKKYPNRFKLAHVKDRKKNSTENSDSCTLGTGMIDYAKILKEAKKYGMEHFMVEQEKYEGTTPIDCAKDNATYMKGLAI